jgi:hypothetical protein
MCIVFAQFFFWRGVLSHGFGVRYALILEIFVAPKNLDSFRMLIAHTLNISYYFGVINAAKLLCCMDANLWTLAN